MAKGKKKDKAETRDVAKEIRKNVEIKLGKLDDIGAKAVNEAIAKTDDDCMERYEEKDSF